MRARHKKALLAGAVALLVLGTGAGVAVAASGDDDAAERPITGSALEKARAAALAVTGEGAVTATEVGDEESTYEVEVTLQNGDQVDVQLDEQFRVVGTEGENEPDDN